jgi:ankyrin repeat protein
MVRILLPKSDAKARQGNEYSALMIAAMYGTKESIKLLIPESEVTATNMFGETALEIFKRRRQYRECEDQMNIVNLLSSNIP